MPYQHEAKPPLVMVVDDNSANRKLLEIVVEEMGWRCVLAGDGAEAVDACRSGASIDLILMDYRMPGMDGCETAQAIRALGGTAADIPIIGVTAEDSQSARAKCIAAGMLACLGKPLQPLAIAALMRRVLGAVGPGAPAARRAAG